MKHRLMLKIFCALEAALFLASAFVSRAFGQSDPYPQSYGITREIPRYGRFLEYFGSSISVVVMIVTLMGTLLTVPFSGRAILCNKYGARKLFLAIFSLAAILFLLQRLIEFLNHLADLS